jgi:hypothetical protein
LTHYSSSQQYEIDSKVASATEILQNNHTLQMRLLQENLNSSHQAFNALEIEFKEALEKEKKSRELLQSSLANRIDELRILTTRDKEQTNTISDLIQLVKELKTKLEKSIKSESHITTLHRVCSTKCHAFHFFIYRNT